MDEIGQWRVITAEPEDSPPTPAAASASHGAAPASPGPRGWLPAALLGGLVIAVVGAAIWLTVPQPNVAVDARSAAAAEANGIILPEASGAGATPTIVATAQLFVDVEGAVLRPGLLPLPSGSRVGDAIRAAGGYSTQVDIAAAAAQLNLAQLLSDGDKVRVPARGDDDTTAQIGQPGSQPSPGAGGDGLIDINHASAEQLDTLPGIGPVTAAKIIAAREEAPFATADELLSRGIVGQSTYDKIAGLVTASD